ncbi:hypothetical protein FRB90_001090 [Tulasnella sp. 427]|nr:hypothetical protein FRB90_001090 [Tulasnella sp. 427]
MDAQTPSLSSVSTYTPKIEPVLPPGQSPPPSPHENDSPDNSMASGEPPPPVAGPSSEAAANTTKMSLRKPIIALPKGKACLECRKRKVKCDAQSPCNGCIRMRKECVYEEEHERILRLQGTVTKLEQKLKRLLADPEVAAAAEATSVSDETDPKAPASGPRFPAAEFTFTMPSGLDDDPPDLSGDWWKLDMPPAPIQMHFGSTLLGYYFLKSGRFLEASYQVSSAARFAITCNLHRISSAVWKPPPTTKKGDPFSPSSSSANLSGGINLTPLLPPPIDAVDVGERINLFWMIVLVDHSASLITGLPTSFDFDNIQTVWPRAIEDYESGAANADKASVESLFDKSSESHTAGLSEMTLLRQTQTKAIVLLERVVKFSNWGKGIDAEQLCGPVFTTTFRSLYDAITRHLAATPPLNIVTSPTVTTQHLSPAPDTPKTPHPRADSAGLAFARAPSSAHSESAASSTAGTSVPAGPPRFILVHVYAMVSYIHLYDALCRDQEADTIEMVPGSYQERLEVARRALRDIRALKASGTDFKKHLMMQGFAWGVVARIFAQHVRKLRKEFGTDDPRVQEAIEELADVVNPIRILAKVFPILEFQLERLRVYEIPIPEG